MSYWDTSALAKLYIAGADSPTYEARFAALRSATIGRIGRLELRAVLRRRESEGALGKGGAQLICQALVASLGTGVLVEQEISSAVEYEFGLILDSCYSHLPRIVIRTNDALHLASARVAGETEFVAADNRLRQAALLMGFAIFPPP